MKTSYIKAALVILSLTATTVAQAQVSEMEREITEGKIAAASADCGYSLHYKTDNPLKRVEKMKLELNSIGEKIADLLEGTDYTTVYPNGDGSMLQSLMLRHENLLFNFSKVDEEIQKEHGYGLALRIDEANKILVEGCRILAEAQADAKKAKK
ncbi:hypothetical protein CIK05_14225 [Bdellovibrio sp. qaytius]|nr:hypothetical protein CIK05_14225 [Bdellovibrio sp. qaytius]